MNGWNYTFDSRLGLSHAKNGRKCQDCVQVRDGERCLVAALSDGIGSREYSEVAAEATVAALCGLFAECDLDTLNLIFLNAVSQEKCEQLKQYLVFELGKAVRARAEESGISLADMDCTLAFVCVAFAENQALVGRVGDSAVCLIRKDGDPEAIADSSFSSNRTHTLLETDAWRRMELRVIDLSDEDIAGFILTSDGLDNELYMKGNDWVCHNAQEYLNALSGQTPESARRTLSARLDDLTTDYPDIFRDDISYAVLSRVQEPVSLPDDPTWLCTCGERNHLWETYCRRCHMDFVKLYRNANFAGEGKAAFFARLNADENRERRTIGLPAKSGFSAPSAFLLILPALMLLILCWNLWIGYSVRHEVRNLAVKVEKLQTELAAVSDKLSPENGDAEDNSELSLAREAAALNDGLTRFLERNGLAETAPSETPPTETVDENGS